MTKDNITEQSIEGGFEDEKQESNNCLVLLFASSETITPFNAHLNFYKSTRAALG